jgi:AmmeMemoRadiSam system protein B
MKRRPVAAGRGFYPNKSSELRSMIANFVDPSQNPENAISIIAPHAGYIYSGAVAGAVYISVKIPETIIIVGPDHYGRTGGTFALWKTGSWQTPMGDVPIESTLAGLILEKSSLAEENWTAHDEEHSLEVQVPFLQYFQKDLRIVPICIDYYASYEDLEELGKGIAESIREFRKQVLLVASTDMSHMVNQETAQLKDQLAITKILQLDPKGLYDIVKEEGISMCGFQAVAAALVASKHLGAQKAELIRYQTSGDRTGDYSSVVGYAGVRIL